MGVQLPAVQFIEKMVGRAPAANTIADVIWVQGLLNRWLAGNGLTVLPLDGVYSQDTAKALLAYQQDQFKERAATGSVKPGDATAQALIRLRPATSITAGKSFATQAGSVVLNKVLLARVLRLSQCLIDTGLVSGGIVLNQGVRDPKVAHRWSTSWNIRKGRVTLQALQALPGGKDLDENVWYDDAWAKDLAKDKSGALNDASSKALWTKIHANAATYYASKAIAAEGYALSDPRIKPNGHKAQSNHIDGRAIDITIPWKAGVKAFGKAVVNGENSDEVANRMVTAFSLIRPVKSERWHFQLPQDMSRGFIAENNLTGGGPAS